LGGWGTKQNPASLPGPAIIITALIIYFNPPPPPAEAGGVIWFAPISPFSLGRRAGDEGLPPISPFSLGRRAGDEGLPPSPLGEGPGMRVFHPPLSEPVPLQRKSGEDGLYPFPADGDLLITNLFVILLANINATKIIAL